MVSETKVILLEFSLVFEAYCTDRRSVSIYCMVYCSMNEWVRPDMKRVLNASLSVAMPLVLLYALNLVSPISTTSLSRTHDDRSTRSAPCQENQRRPEPSWVLVDPELPPDRLSHSFPLRSFLPTHP